jgi:hypothetical protein
VAGAREGVAFLEEFRAAGFREAQLLRAIRNTRTKNVQVLAAEVWAIKSRESEDEPSLVRAAGHGPVLDRAAVVRAP